MKNIPKIDLSQYGSSDDQHVQKALMDACSTLGFSVLTNHGIEHDLIDKLYAVSQEFFNLPFEDKRLCQHDGSHGFIPHNTFLGTDRILNKKIYTQYETFVDTHGKHEIETQFPKQLSQMQEILDEYIKAMKNLGDKLVLTFLNMLGVAKADQDWLLSDNKQGLKLLHYPKPSADNDYEARLGEHTDTCFLTLLTVEAIGFTGLQVKDLENDAWIDVSLDNQYDIIMNTGAFMEVLTAGKIKSTLHRVIPLGKERFSCPVFYSTYLGSEIKPLS